MPASVGFVLPLADSRTTIESVGGKGASLARLLAAGLPVPDGFHVTTVAYQHFVRVNDLQPAILSALASVDGSQPATLDAAARRIQPLFAQAPMPDEIADAIAREYARLRPDNPAVAVRSSATAEDLPDLSFAGQHETYLNIRGAAAVIERVKQCWASLWTARAIGYRAQHHIGTRDSTRLSLAVVVQLLAPAEASGILFTANPLNGRRDQAVISASWGLGEAIVGGLVTPDSVTLDKQTNRVISRETADKQVMTVLTEGGTEERSVPEARRHSVALDDRAAADLLRLGLRIEQLYRAPMDIEWTWANGDFSIVQARPITALRDLELAEPVDWPLPQPKGIYMRSSIIELLPDPLTPLFATLGRSIINQAYRRFAATLTGPNVFAGELVVTINDYAYYSVRFSTGQMLKVLRRLPFKLPGLLRLAAGSEERWRNEARPRYLITVERWQAKQLSELSASDLVRGAREIIDVAIDHYLTLQAGIIPNAATSEAIFTKFYERFVRRSDEPQALTFILGFESEPIRAEKSLWDIAEWCRALPGLSAYLLRTEAQMLASVLNDERVPREVDAKDWHEWQRRVLAHLQTYGHSIYDLDFAKRLPVDDPTPWLETLKCFVSGRGNNPHTRQQTAAAEREQATKEVLARVTGLRGRILRRLIGWAQRYAPLREDGLADVGLGWPLLRKILQEFGRRMLLARVIEKADDIFWLHEDEVERAAAALDRAESLSGMACPIKERKATWCAEKRVTPPPVLPRRAKWMWISLEKWSPARADDAGSGNLIKGVGASPGQVTGSARVLRGPEEFGRMKQGEVLVAAITTPAWTPLFALASGIVTDVGGPLSHSSIVAREYGIPAVLGTGVATQRIRSELLIKVDGNAGVVTLLDQTEGARGS
ncbi:MAG TPA: PEP/pyruvate-binding domain-containing protein [Terriglobia bacterium]|nr:PEP/pyruvate-binding domain-containing protein [Terriglobia bacterium]